MSITPDFAAILHEDQLAAKVPELCPTCGGSGHTEAIRSPRTPDDCTCSDAPTIAKLLAIGVAVMTKCAEFDDCAWTAEQVKRCEFGTHPIIAGLRAVQP